MKVAEVFQFQGARGASAGNDFHILWVLRSALSLLDTRKRLCAVTIEDVSNNDTENIQNPDLLLGVDCAFYYGGTDFVNSEKVEYAQLKYSPSSPDKKWTVARLTASSSKRKNNSIIKRLADIFLHYKDKNSETDWSIAFITNQKISEDFCQLVHFYGGKVDQKHFQSNNNVTLTYKKIQKATSLNQTDLETFLSKLDFSKCGNSSRFLIEEDIILQLSKWVDSSAKKEFVELYEKVLKLTLPENRKFLIKKETIFTWLGLSSELGVFPVPSEINKIVNIVPRNIANKIIDEIQDHQIICLHGHGGAGKTTLLQEICLGLPKDSKMVTYDCYGGGEYLNSDKIRHLPKEAFTQLSNELAVEMKTADFLIANRDINYAKAFLQRLEGASESLFKINKKAFLIIAIDAADNAIIASEQNNDNKCFVKDIISLSTIPNNIKIIFTCRTGRLQSFNFEETVKQYFLSGFTEGETKIHLKKYFDNLNEKDIQHFHYISDGNPRFQQYAIINSNNNTNKLLNPKYTNLNEIFKDQITEASKKSGNINIKEFVGILLGLPRPLPISYLADILNISEEMVIDICNDLTPGICIKNQTLEFLDEDFEGFLRDYSELYNKKDAILKKISDCLLRKQDSDFYAAFNVADALVSANRIDELLSIIDNNIDPEIARDSLLKKQIVNRRLKLGLLCCTKMNSKVKAFKVLLAAAEAMKIEEAFFSLLIKNPKLSVAFTSDSLSKSILQNNKYSFSHGSIRFHMALNAAEVGNMPIVRQNLSWAYHWVKNRNLEEDSNYDTWKNPAKDIASGIKALIIMEGSKIALKELYNWKPRRLRQKVFYYLVENLKDSGNLDEIENLLYCAGTNPLEKILILVPLLLNKKIVNESIINKSIRCITKLPKIHNKNVILLGEKNSETKVFDILLQFIELAYLNGTNRDLIKRALENLFPLEDCLVSHNYISCPSLTDITLRATFLYKDLISNLSLENILFSDINNYTKDGITEKEKRDRFKKKEDSEEIIDLFNFLIPIYEKRLMLLTSKVNDDQINNTINNIINKIITNSWRFRSQWYYLSILEFIESISIIIFIMDEKSTALISLQKLINFDGSDTLGTRRSKFLTKFLTIESLHDNINTIVNKNILPDIQKNPDLAQHKSEAYLLCSELLFYINIDDSRYYFEKAIEITNQIDEDAFEQIKLINKISLKVNKSKSFSNKRLCAHKISLFITDTAIKLDGMENFPWIEGINALTNIDNAISLSFIGRLHDRDLVTLYETMPTYLKSSLKNGFYNAKEVICLAMLLKESSSEISEDIIMYTTQKIDKIESYVIFKELANDIIMHSSLSQRLKKGKVLLNNYNDDNDNTIKLLSETVNLLENNVITENISEQNTLLDYDLSEINYTDIDSIKLTITTLQNKKIFNQSAIFKQIRTYIKQKDRVKHLDCIAQLIEHSINKNILRETISDWQDSPAVQNWIKENLPSYIVAHLPYLSYNMRYNTFEVENLINFFDSRDTNVIDIILKGIQNNAEQFNNFELYNLLGIITEYLTEEENTEVLEYFVNRLEPLIDNDQDKDINFNLIPLNIYEAIGRFVYSLLGDVNKAVRWRAAHSIRRMARLNLSDMLSGVLQNVSIKEEKHFRAHEFPFYWIAARQWLSIALLRISEENGEILIPHLQKIAELAIDQKLPHVVIRHFLKKTVNNLLKIKPDILSAKVIKEINELNINTLKNKKRVNVQKMDELKKDRLFTFNSLDTIPYWYREAANMFFTPKNFDFLDEAEYFICNLWGILNNPGRFENEPRKNYFKTVNYSYYDHRHGSEPSIERFARYLEFHAMMCVVGNMINKYPLIQEDYNKTLNEWLNHYIIPRNYWLSDLRSPTPLEKKFLIDTDKSTIEEWIANIKNKDFDTEIGLSDDDDKIIVKGYYSLKTKYGYQQSYINSALVLPEKSAKLLHNIQIAKSYINYSIPDESFDEEESTKDNAVGWIINNEIDGIDNKDPYSKELDNIEYIPGSLVSKTLNLNKKNGDIFNWYKRDSKTPTFEYYIWSDTPKNSQYVSSPSSHGKRLYIQFKDLLEFLATIK